jgi:hypothetical protein
MPRVRGGAELKFLKQNRAALKDGPYIKAAVQKNGSEDPPLRRREKKPSASEGGRYTVNDKRRVTGRGKMWV